LRIVLSRSNVCLRVQGSRFPKFALDGSLRIAGTDRIGPERLLRWLFPQPLDGAALPLILLAETLGHCSSSQVTRLFGTAIAVRRSLAPTLDSG